MMEVSLEGSFASQKVSYSLAFRDAGGSFLHRLLGSFGDLTMAAGW
jgi:hypothetical protein